jgi:hypothetical protein
MTIRKQLDKEIEAAEKKEEMSRDWRITQIAFLRLQIIKEREEKAVKENGQG